MAVPVAAVKAGRVDALLLQEEEVSRPEDKAAAGDERARFQARGLVVKPDG